MQPQQQYETPIGPRRLSPFARLMQLVGLLDASGKPIQPERTRAPKAVRKRRKRERQNRRRGRQASRR